MHQATYPVWLVELLFMVGRVLLVVHWYHFSKANHGYVFFNFKVSYIRLCSFQQWVGSVDIFPNEDADANVVLAATESWTEQEKEVSAHSID